MANHRHKPAHDIRLGRIRAAIWANENEQGQLWFAVTITRLYKDNGQWKDTSNYGRDDLPIVAKVADMAYAWIWRRQVPTTPDDPIQ